MSTPDKQEKNLPPESVKAGDVVESRAERKASGEAETGKDNFYENVTKRAQALRKAREDGLTTGTHQEFGTPTIADDAGKALIKGGAPSKITLSEERIQELMKEHGRNRPEAAATVDQAFRDRAARGSAEQTGTVIDYEPARTSNKSFKVGMDYEEKPPDTRTPLDKLGDFMQAAAHRATDPEGWKAWAQGEINKFAGIGAGLNEAKDETKAAVAAGWKALTDGTVVEFLSQPNAINAPLFKTVANAFDAMSKDPEVVNHAFEALGKAVMKASEGYSNLPDYEKGKVIGKVMFGMVNPEGSTEGAEAALKVADQVATHVDKAVWGTIDQTMKAIKDMAPDLAEQTKQALYDYIQKQGLSGPELEAAGIPRGYFDGMQQPPGAGKGDNLFAMSGKGDEGGEGLPRKTEGESISEKLPPSESFVAELKQAEDRMDEGEREFLELNHVKIIPVRRLPDVVPGTEKLGACYSPADNAIFVPEQIPKLGEWVPNDNVEFAMRHEFGHVFNVKYDRLSGSLSDDPDFIQAYKADHAKLSVSQLKELQILERTPVDARDEVFADMYGHVSAGASDIEANSAYSLKLKAAFPGCLKYLEDFLKR